MTRRAFLNIVKALNNVDMPDLVSGGVIAAGDIGEASKYLTNPIRWLALADDARGEKLWALLQGRI